MFVMFHRAKSVIGNSGLLGIIIAVGQSGKLFVDTDVLCKSAIDQFDVTVGIALDQRYFMCDQHDQSVTRYFFEYIHDLDRIFCIEIARGFIRENYFAPLYQCACDSHSLLLPARKCVGKFVFISLHIDERQRIFRPF